MSTAAALASATLAVEDSKVTPGIIGFLVVFVLGLATWLLIRSMNTQLRKVDFEEKDTEPEPDADGSDDRSGSSPGV